MKLFDNPQLEELDLVINGMEDPADETRVQSLLSRMHGVQAARIIPEGAWIRYEPEHVTKEKICQALTQAGFEAQLFQDSLSGEAVNVSQA